MNEERYILAELKRWLAANGQVWMNGQDVLVQIAKIEADAVLGEELADDPREEQEAN